MKGWLRRLRGLLGLGALGGIAGALIGVGWVMVEILLGGSSTFRPSVGTMSAVWGVVGASTGVGFGILLTATSGRRRLEDVTYGRAALLGGIAGAVCPIIVGSVVAGSLPPLGIGLWLAGVGGCVGAGVGAGLVGVAKRAQRRDALHSADPSPLIG